jgi:hypothetical protein
MGRVHAENVLCPVPGIVAYERSESTLVVTAWVATREHLLAREPIGVCSRLRQQMWIRVVRRHRQQVVDGRPKSHERQ